MQFEEVQKLAARKDVGADGVYLIDARPKESYSSGHIPTSLSFDFPTALLDDGAGHTYLRDPAALKEEIAQQLGAQKLDEILSGKQAVVNSA